MDLYYYTLQFARENKFTKEQTSAFFSIVKKTHEICIGNVTLIIDVIRNSANVGFSQLIGRYKQSFTVRTSLCTAIHNRMTKVLDILSLISQGFFLLKFVCTPGLAGENPKYFNSRVTLQTININYSEKNAQNINSSVLRPVYSFQQFTKYTYN